MKRLVIFFGSLLFVFVIAALIVFYGRGYRLDFNEKRIAGTGILSISSIPTGAAVYLDDEFKDATDASIQNLPPGKYKVRLAKEGYSEWQKEVEIIKEKVTPIEATLFPTAPSLSALTFSGVISPKLSPDGQKIAYGIENEDKAGLWVLELGGRQLIFSKSPQQIAQDSEESFVFSKAKFTWSSDSKSLLVSGKGSSGKLRNYLLDAGNLNEDFVDISAEVQELKKEWKKDGEIKDKDRLNKLGKEAEKLAEGASKLLFSPDEERVLILKKGKKPIVYDSNPSLVPDANPKSFEIPKALDYTWYPSTNRHIILVKEDSINIVEADGLNDVTIYTGDFRPDVFFPWPDGSKLVIATTLNTAISKKPNLYSITLR